MLKKLRLLDFLFVIIFPIFFAVSSFIYLTFNDNLVTLFNDPRYPKLYEQFQILSSFALAFPFLWFLVVHIVNFVFKENPIQLFIYIIYLAIEIPGYFIFNKSLDYLPVLALCIVIFPLYPLYHAIIAILEYRKIKLKKST